MEKELLISQNPHWKGDKNTHPNTIQRKKYTMVLEKECSNDRITILTGLRRIGKTTLMKLTINHLLSQGIDPNHILYYSCDTYGGIKIENIRDFITSRRNSQEIDPTTKVYIFLDEITVIAHLHEQLKTVYDLSVGQSNTVKLFVSASSATILNDQKAMLTGRHTTITVHPLDYEEFLIFKGIKEQGIQQGTHFYDRIITGGIPEYVLTGDASYVQSLIFDIIHKDIILAYDLRETKKIEQFFQLLIERVGKQISLNKIANTLDISKQSITKRYHLFLQSYLFYDIKRFGTVNESIRNPKKLYICDNALLTIFKGTKEIGYAYENCLFHTIRKYDPAYYYANGVEIDFIIGDHTSRTLIEAKRRNDLSAGQKNLLESYPGPKYICEGYDGYMLAKNL